MIIEGTLYYINPEKIKIGDKNFRPAREETLENMEERIIKKGFRNPFVVTRVGKELVTYSDFNTLIAARKIGKELVPCVIISHKLMNKRIKYINLYRRYSKLKTIWNINTKYLNKTKFRYFFWLYRVILRNKLGTYLGTIN